MQAGCSCGHVRGPPRRQILKARGALGVLTPRLWRGGVRDAEFAKADAAHRPCQAQEQGQDGSVPGASPPAAHHHGRGLAASGEGGLLVLYCTRALYSQAACCGDSAHKQH